MRFLCNLEAVVIFVLGVAAFAPAALSQGTVHRVLIGDTFDASLGPKADAGLQAFGKATQQIASATGRGANTIAIVGNNFTCDRITKAVSGIAKTSEDLVIIFYAGHGFRDENQKSKFPMIFCDHGATGGILLEDLVTRAQQVMAPKMIWVIADACNVTYEEAAGLPAAALGPSEILAYKKLFSEPRGQVVMAGAHASEFSWYWASGGQFTTQLIKAVMKQIEAGPNASWPTLIEDSMRPFHLVYEGPITHEKKPYDQRPERLVGLQLASGPFNLP